MASDLTADASIRTLGEAIDEKYVLDTSALQVIYKGQPMMIDQSEDNTGPIRGFKTTVTANNTDVFIGIAAEGKTVAAADPETTEIDVLVGPTIVGFVSTVFTAGADDGKAVFMDGSATLCKVAGAVGVVQIGKVHRVRDGYCFVELDTPFICASAGAP